MFKNIIKNISITKLLVSAQIKSMSSLQASSTASINYGDYVKFLELVGNCKVSERNFLNEKKKKFSSVRHTNEKSKKFQHDLVNKNEKEKERRNFFFSRSS